MEFILKFETSYGSNAETNVDAIRSIWEPIEILLEGKDYGSSVKKYYHVIRVLFDEHAKDMPPVEFYPTPQKGTFGQ